MLTTTPYTASASVPEYLIIWRLKSTVSIPIAASIKKVEKPVTNILRSFAVSFTGFTSRSVLFFDKKWQSIAAKVSAAPIAVASPAPMMPILQVKTKK